MERLRLPPSDAYTLQVLDHLAAGRRVTAAPDPAAPATLTPELVDVGLKRLASHCLDFLLRAGGHRERTVLREGRRVRARLWDDASSGAFRLQLSAASREVWALLLKPAPRRRGNVKGLSAKRIRARSAQDRGPRMGGVGDWLFFALAQANLARGRLGGWNAQDVLALLEVELGLLSPLATLGSLRPRTPGGQELPLWLGKLAQPACAPVLESMDDALVGWWTDRLRAALELRPLGARAECLAGAGRVLSGYLDALDAARRADLCRALMRLSVVLASELLAGTADEVRQTVIHRAPPRSMAQRDEATQAAASVAALGTRLLDLRDEMAACGYGDERYEEAQLYVADADALLVPARERLLTVAHALGGQLG